MKAIIYYAAQHPAGTSARIADALKAGLPGVVACNIRETPAAPGMVSGADHLIFITATYGDQELHDDMEALVLALKDKVKGKKYFICEVGNYYGYDDYTFGAARIIDEILREYGAIAAAGIASVDSLPLLDQQAVGKWVSEVKSYFTS
jgi:flavodoxin